MHIGCATAKTGKHSHRLKLSADEYPFPLCNRYDRLSCKRRLHTVVIFIITSTAINL